MAERRPPAVYTIAAHRGFADALVAGLLPRYRDPQFGLARLTLLLPSRRTVRTVSEAFVRLAGQEEIGGLLLPRMVAVGDLDLDETLGPLFDALSADIPPAADPIRRWLRLAAFLQEIEGDAARPGAGMLRRAFEIGQSMDRLLVEGIEPSDLISDRVLGIVLEMQGHWQESTATFLRVQDAWLKELALRGEVDGPTRRNMLFAHAAQQWRDEPPQHPIVAAGVTSASPALAKLLRVVSELPQGAVILPDLDLALDKEIWDELGNAGIAPEPDAAPIGKNDAVTHPQYHLKVLLNRMGIARIEVQHWHRSGMAASPPERSKAISNLFLPPAGSAQWVDLPARARRLSDVRIMETPNPGAEAQAISVLIREVLEVPGKRVALVTPDRGLASRVSALLRRWDIEADDTAGVPLSQTVAGRLLLLLAELVAEQFAPVPLIAALSHPLVRRGEDRAAWLDRLRALDLALRGPRPDSGLAALRTVAGKARQSDWWQGAESILAPLSIEAESLPLSELLDRLASTAEAFCGEDLWANADGRALAAFVDELREAGRDADCALDPREIHAVLRDAMDRVAVRPPWGGHPRVSIYGLLEARMSRADLVICGGLVEGVWPGSAAPDPLLPPAVMRALGVPGADFRIGLAAHDLAGALGAPEVVLSHALRDDGAPVVPSRFVLRVKALLGELAERHEEKEAVRLGRLLDDAPPVQEPYPRPKPDPSPEQRKVGISVTGLDRLRSDPYQFYASSILRLRRIDALDAEPSAAWKGTAVHEILDRWHKAGETVSGLHPIADEVLDTMSAHPLMRSLWRPRLMAGLEWIADEVSRLRSDEGRLVLGTEINGEMIVRGVRVHGRADRIDRLTDGTLAIVDYKTGQPPKARQVAEGFALPLGLVALIAQSGGFSGISGDPARFEYWSLAKSAKRKDEIAAFGYVDTPILEGRKKSGVEADQFLLMTQGYLDDALDRWILGSDPFTARLNPDLAVYTDYDQLMRLDEWLPGLTDEERNEA
ncbi:MAG: double-strand break repair protein AddB [Novosphingobium sp.]|nr:double-strand break repair protein AddB [Novosphingobium sp.]